MRIQHKNISRDRNKKPEKPLMLTLVLGLTLYVSLIFDALLKHAACCHYIHSTATYIFTNNIAKFYWSI